MSIGIQLGPLTLFHSHTACTVTATSTAGIGALRRKASGAQAATTRPIVTSFGSRYSRSS